MLMLVVFFALIRIIVYFIHDKLNKNAPLPVTDEDKTAVENKYKAVRSKILYISIALFVIGVAIGSLDAEHNNSFLLFSGVIIALFGCVGFIARTMIAPKPNQ